jgi:hypothetical protein
MGRTGKCVTFNVPNAFTYFRLYSGDMVVRLMPDAPVAATVNTIQTKEQFVSLYNDGDITFQAYEP